LANRYSLGMYITHPRGIHRCFVLDDSLKFSQDFRGQNKSVVNAFSIKMLVPALHPYMASAHGTLQKYRFCGNNKSFLKGK